MNRQHFWKIAPLCLLLTSLAWHAQAQDGEEKLGISNDENIVESAIIEATNAVSRSIGPVPVRVRRSGGGGGGGGYGGEDRLFIKLSNPAQQLNQQSHKLVQKYRNSSDTQEREEAQVALQEIVSQQFELLQKARESELAKLKKELDRLQTLHDRREDQKDRIVGNRVQSLLREADGLGWGGTSSNSRRNSPFEVLGGGQSSAFPSQGMKPVPLPVNIRSTVPTAPPVVGPPVSTAPGDAAGE